MERFFSDEYHQYAIWSQKTGRRNMMHPADRHLSAIHQEFKQLSIEEHMQIFSRFPLPLLKEISASTAFASRRRAIHRKIKRAVWEIYKQEHRYPYLSSVRDWVAYHYWQIVSYLRSSLEHKHTDHGV